jgi:hypothetical protein
MAAADAATASGVAYRNFIVFSFYSLVTSLLGDAGLKNGFRRVGWVIGSRHRITLRPAVCVWTAFWISVLTVRLRVLERIGD